MKKSNVISIVILLVAIGTGILVFMNRKEDLENSKIIIKKYESGTSKVEKEVDVTSKSNVRKMDEFVNRMTSSVTGGMLDLSLTEEKMLSGDIEVNYKNTVTIKIQLDEKQYCHYTNLDNGISKIIYMPDELYEWVLGKL